MPVNNFLLSSRSTCRMPYPSEAPDSRPRNWRCCMDCGSEFYECLCFCCHFKSISNAYGPDMTGWLFQMWHPHTSKLSSIKKSSINQCVISMKIMLSNWIIKLAIGNMTGNPNSIKTPPNGDGQNLCSRQHKARAAWGQLNFRPTCDTQGLVVSTRHHRGVHFSNEMIYDKFVKKHLTIGLF